ncbi:hypothetical protein LTR91_008498 [Friedmanniomyces endolithicus]|uniref:Uncharacterized protein n=3 Tax=Dothideomycetidae TaxID=451867 RepID=A0AAN6QU51_9PEZI|nr:hypothetical protein LTS09_002085 [Friedmanniomyces endolithicus]KAK5142186.1 hypothetical protein LTR32_005416 [Rachicladosporium monterosium]KAK0364782.1 hypothetical protein LTR94_009482 [Friedmanniomyces endolithicus]KAK0798456.1 hypothetical protein LTR59_006461 [Friedmanniomyces endolithicus]KAK0804361.1 hypothetical protein LTR75_007676 [Friedmanniomyces endolithicus]
MKLQQHLLCHSSFTVATYGIASIIKLSMATVNIIIRPPSFSAANPPLGYQSPTLAWLTETWHVTHSTLPMWKNKRNVRIQYTPLPPSTGSNSAASETDRIDDLVTYQGLTGDKVTTLHGVDKLSTTTSTGSNGQAKDAWDWRGKGWLKIAGSHWEVLGWGEEVATGNKWVVTEFAKTLFTPAGVDVYSQRPEGLQQITLEGIKRALEGTGDENVKRMAVELFEIKRDDARND